MTPAARLQASIDLAAAIAADPRPADQVVAEVGMVIDPRQHPRVQRLQHQRGQTAGQHPGEVGVDAPGDTVRAEQAGIAGRPVVVDPGLAAGKGLQHPLADRRCGVAGEQRIPGHGAW